MDEKTEQLIRELAEKFGTTTEHLWGILVKQAQIEAWTQIILLCFGLLAATILFIFAFKMKRKENDDWCDGALLIGGTSIVLGFIMLVAVPVVFVNATTSFLNPEYRAFKQLLPK